MDEEIQAPAENTQVAEDSALDTSPVDETQTSESTETDGEAEQTPTNEMAAEDTDDSERKPSRAERRIRQLAEQNKQLRSGPNQFAPSYGQPPQGLFEPGAEYSVEDVNQRVAQAAQSIALPQVEQLRTEFETKEALRNFDSDLSVIESKFEELKEDSPNYIPELEAEISEEYQQKAYRLIGFDPVSGQPQYRIDPSVRLADIAKRKVDFARAIATKSSADMKNAVARTADESAIKPNGSRNSDRAFKDLSIEEMESQLGVVRQ